MAKYVGDITSPGSFGPGPKVCPDKQATAWDNITKACFPIFGVGIVIGDTSASVHAGFEVCNYNFHTKGTSRPAVNPLQLKGPVLV
jgi:hypothetical protein